MQLALLEVFLKQETKLYKETQINLKMIFSNIKVIIVLKILDKVIIIHNHNNTKCLINKLIKIINNNIKEIKINNNFYNLNKEINFNNHISNFNKQDKI